MFCAAGLTDVITEITGDFEKESETEMKFCLLGTLARQIGHGATPSIYISAIKKWLDYLNQE
ncbi:MAG: substrate-binding domain-containing protein [Tangfeifania sp.]